jgi:hypothetical protein
MKTSAFFGPKQRNAFRDKYLAAIIAVAALFISSIASAQFDSIKYSSINGYGFKYKRHAQDSVAIMPQSNSPHTPYRAGGYRYNISDTCLELWTGSQWIKDNRAVQLSDSSFKIGDSTIIIHGTGGGGGGAPSGPAGGALSGNYPNPSIADDSITTTKFRQSAALSVIGNPSNATDYPIDILALNDGSVLRRFGTSLNFGAINLASSNAVIGVLANGNLDTAGLKAIYLPIHHGVDYTVYQGGHNTNFSDTLKVYKSIGIGTTRPASAFHISMQSNGTTGDGLFMRVTDTRSTGNYQMAGTYWETSTNSAQVFTTTGDGLGFEPYNSKRGTYLRNLTSNGGVYITTNKDGNERKSMSLIGDSVGIGWGHSFSGAAYSGGFGGYSTLIGAQTFGNGVAVGWSAGATNVEAVAVGPQCVANAFATIAIGDGAMAVADSTTGNEIVMGDAVWAKGNINYLIGGGAGIHHDYVMALGATGSSTAYDLDVSTANHQGLLGWYQHDGLYFSDGRGLFNDWWLGGPQRASSPHDITLNMTSAIGGDHDGIHFKINGSRGTGAGTPGDIIFQTSDAVGTDTVLQSLTAKFTIKGSGNILAKSLITTGTAPTTSGATKMVVSDENGLLSFTDIPAGSGGGITTLNGLTSSSQGFSVDGTGTDFTVASTSSTHAFHMPSASATARGLVTTGSQIFAGDKQFNDNIGIGIANTGTGSILIDRSNLDGGGTDFPSIRLRNSNASDPAGSGYNLAALTIGSGNDAILAQFGTTYGAGATAPWNQQGFIIATRTDDPVIFYTGASSTKQLIINNNGVVGITSLGGGGTQLVTADNSGQLGTTSIPSDNSIATGSRTATGSYTQDWNHNPLTFNNVNQWSFNVKETESTLHVRKLKHLFSTGTSFYTGTTLSLLSSLRNLADNSDSVTTGFINYSSAGDNFAGLISTTSAGTSRVEIGQYSGNVQIGFGTKFTAISLDTTRLILTGQDSILLKGISTSTPDSLLGIKSTTGGFAKIVKIVQPKKYVALLTQTSTSAPTATVLDNTIGSIVWTRSSAGTYVGTLTGAFIASKTWCQANWSDESASGNIVFRLKRTGNNTVELGVSPDGVSFSDVFTNLSVEIRVYP